MKLSKPTVDILRTFATINPNLHIGVGKKITTIGEDKDILAEFESDDEFENEVSIFNLTEFLGAYGAFKDPEIQLEDKYCVIKQGRNKVKYNYAEKGLLLIPQKSVAMPSSRIEFELTEEILSKLSKMAAILSAADLEVSGDGEKISLRVFDKDATDKDGNFIGNDFVIDLDTPTTEEFNVYFKIAKLRLFPSDYKVEISDKRVSRWTAKTIKLTVYIASEMDSKFH